MEVKNLNISYKVYQSINELDEVSQNLLAHARKSMERAYARYSEFYVGAALLLENGEIIEGNNQENAAYPSSLCAERVAFFYASSRYPDVKIKRVAVVASSKNYKLMNPITPCGACRQVMSEYEVKQEEAIPVVMNADCDEVYEMESIKHFLPLLFSAESLRGK